MCAPAGLAVSVVPLAMLPLMKSLPPDVVTARFALKTTVAAEDEGGVWFSRQSKQL